MHECSAPLCSNMVSTPQPCKPTTSHSVRKCRNWSRNRGAGPFGLLNLVDDRCGGVFDNIDDVIPKAERDEFMLRYKTAAGFAAEKLNAAASTIPPGARIARQLSQGTA